ncbi:FAD/NAD(P)-binding domain-containing protein [Rickenella mellea]|uniref:FAD/NAD(P)-binding domain-containing protein n=1 Tax=Rickenella mellea TaxID=50990 RepID=A0A4Y7PNL3_9AGAM|nr:FAD/NAD(P)-binding domain-containing protein [Rickenella mellea]
MVNSIKDVADHAFDYVIAGGGTAGLALAAGLAANSSTQVLVLEAGPENLEESSPMRIPAPPGVVINDPKYAWVFKSSPQKHLEGREVVVQRGRMLGGSSAVNFTVWNHPPAGDVDAWEKLGNPGWNWELFQKYAKKAESFTASSPERQELYRQEPHLSSHGVDGPLKTKFPDWVFKGEVTIQNAMQSLGIPVAKDPYGGDPIGTSMLAACVDPCTHTRSYAATAYYLPNKEKANLTVLCNAIVERVVFNDQHDDENAVISVKKIIFPA